MTFDRALLLSAIAAIVYVYGGNFAVKTVFVAAIFIGALLLQWIDSLLFPNCQRFGGQR